MVDWTITLHAAVSDVEMAMLGEIASEHGITDCTTTSGRRIITAETERDEQALNWVVAWLAEGLLEVSIIAQIKEERIYWPEFEEDTEPFYEVDLF